MIKCFGNLQQIGLGLKMYESDFHKYPPLFQIKNGRLRRFQGAVGGATGSTVGKPNYELIPPAEERPLFNYVRVHDLFKCPSDRGQNTDITPLLPTVFSAVGCSYSYNGWTPNSVANRSEIVVQEPSKFILMYEPSAIPVNTKGGDLWYFQWHYARGKATLKNVDSRSSARFVSPILFFDGHVRKVDFTRRLLDAGNPTASTPDWIWQNGLVN